MYTRRNFGKTLLAGIPAAASFAAQINYKYDGVMLGSSTYSFRMLPRTPDGDAVGPVIQALTDCNIGVIELFSPHIEPAFAAFRAPQGNGSERPTRQEVAAAYRAWANGPEAKKAREDLRQWRLGTPLDHFEGIKKRFNDAGITIYVYGLNYRQDFTDDELEKTFEQAKGLGTKIIATSTQQSMMKRLLPLAEKHKIYIAFHGHDQTSNPEEFSSPETFQKAIDMSKWSRVNLDIGHFSAAGFDPVSYIEQHHDRITHLHIKDRKKDHGPNVPFGEGDTPIRQVLLLLKDKKYPIPALVEYEYRGTGTPVEEVKKCMDFMKQAVA